MLLAIDVGNTNTVLGAFEGKDLRHTWRVSTHPLCTPDEFRAKLASIMALNGIQLPDFSAVAVSSVVPSFTSMLRDAFSKFKTYFIDHQSPFSFAIKAAPASGVGADRLVNAEATVREYGTPAIIVDSGTATTLCAISSQREYLGGAIMPGIELSVEALAKKAAKLFAVELIPPSSVIGSNTGEALRSGLLLGYASMIEGMVDRFCAALEDDPLKRKDIKIVATGGISQLLKGLTKNLQHFDKDLTLKGIAYLYDAIRSGT